MDRSICTGRQAIAVGYQWIADNLDKERIGKDFSIRRRSTGNSIWQCFTGRRKKRETEVELARAQLRPGMVWKELWSKKTMEDEQRILRCHACECDAILLEEVENR